MQTTYSYWALPDSFRRRRRRLGAGAAEDSQEPACDVQDCKRLRLSQVWGEGGC